MIASIYIKYASNFVFPMETLTFVLKRLYWIKTFHSAMKDH